jgi:hypothetical protein
MRLSARDIKLGHALHAMASGNPLRQPQEIAGILAACPLTVPTPCMYTYV